MNKNIQTAIIALIIALVAIILLRYFRQTIVYVVTTMYDFFMGKK